jgi:hypothetical protein
MSKNRGKSKLSKTVIFRMPINMFFIVKNHWEPSFTDNLRMTDISKACCLPPSRSKCFIYLIVFLSMVIYLVGNTMKNNIYLAEINY